MGVSPPVPAAGWISGKEILLCKIRVLLVQKRPFDRRCLRIENDNPIGVCPFVDTDIFVERITYKLRRLPASMQHNMQGTTFAE